MQKFLYVLSLCLVTIIHCFSFETIQIPNLGGTVLSYDINNHNIIVGQSDFTSHAFKYDLSTDILTDLSSLSGIGVDSSATGINSRGDITGNTSSGSYFLAANTNTAQQLPLSTTPLIINGNTYTPTTSRASKINNCRNICGTQHFEGVNSPADIIARPMVFIPNKGMIDLGTPPGTTRGSAFDINANSVIVGATFLDAPSKATVWKINTCTFTKQVVSDIIEIDLGPVAAAGATAINDKDQVVGFFLDSNIVSRAFLWSEKNGAQEIDLSSLGAVSSDAYGINNLGVVVGIYRKSDNIPRGYVWREDVGAVDLGITLLSSSGSHSINDLGVVILNDAISSFAIFTNNLE